MQANLLAIEDATNTKKTENLLCFAFDNRKQDEVLSRSINVAKIKMNLISFFEQPSLQFIAEIPLGVSDFIK